MKFIERVKIKKLFEKLENSSVRSRTCSLPSFNPLHARQRRKAEWKKGRPMGKNDSFSCAMESRSWYASCETSFKAQRSQRACRRGN